MFPLVLHQRCGKCLERRRRGPEQIAEAGGRGSVNPLLEAGAATVQGERERHDWVRCSGRAAVTILNDVERV